MAGRTAWVLGDQLSHDNPVLEGADRVLIVESGARLRSRPHHRQRAHLFLVAMRSFAAELEERGFDVDYRRSRSLATGVAAHRRSRKPDELSVLAPSSRGGRRGVESIAGVEIAEGTLFLTSAAEFAEWAEGRKRLVMESFYRRQRRRLGVLMDGDDPAGGSWNFDPENRRTPPAGVRPPAPYRPRESEIDQRVRADLDRMKLDGYGEDGPRLWPATAAQAKRALSRFVEERLPEFGPWQDAMLNGERFMWHAHLSSALNMGLLAPMDCVEAAERAYRDGGAPIASVEGFVRQVIGWREYVHGMHWLGGRRGRRANALRAKRPLPDLLWTGDTEMRCVADAVTGLRETAYAHHIERLMLFGNLMLLLGCDPHACLDWFRDSFIDGNEWVMDANVLGMATYADGGGVMTKPYAATGRYIDRMSDHCGECRYDPKQRTGEEACPYSTLYWDFLDRNRERLADNHRMRMAYRNLERFDEEELDEIRSRARSLRRRAGA
ncbi:MAG: cryptochrome/photolyase family protein [Solirubrobacterales bacterium]